MRQHEKDSQKSKSVSLLVIRFVPIIIFYANLWLCKELQRKRCINQAFFFFLNRPAIKISCEEDLIVYQNCPLESE